MKVPLTTHELLPDQILGQRPFTHPRHTGYDARLLRYLLQRLTSLFATDQVDPRSSDLILFKDDEPDGRSLRQIVVNPAGLSDRRDLTVVGFFGQRRIDAEESALNSGDSFLVNTLAEHNGLLSYSTIELTCGNFANCVLFVDDQAKTYWGRHPEHARLAAEISPEVYQTVRIYNGRLANGLTPGRELILFSAKYYDFTETPPWRAIRMLESSPGSNRAG